MNGEKIRNWLEIIALFSVVASLIFVGLEMRQSQRIALSAAYQARADSSMVIRMAAVESEAIQSANGKLRAGQGFADLSPEELSAIYSLMAGNMIYLENMHYQHLNGFISDEHWATNRAELTGLLRQDAQWRRRELENCSYYRESFCAEIKAAVTRIEAGE
ncbi:MAG: hypothetical protein R3192_10005 [Woeseiaceae bacterium]|nr:hypothetical protein [Woeseiaceae bacterium]